MQFLLLIVKISWKAQGIFACNIFEYWIAKAIIAGKMWYFGNGLEMTVLFLFVLTPIVLIRTDSQVAPVCVK